MNDKSLSVQLDDKLKAEFLGLAEHIGITPEEALLDAINHWIGRNAAIFHYTYGTDRPETEANECPTRKN